MEHSAGDFVSAIKQAALVLVLRAQVQPLFVFLKTYTSVNPVFGNDPVFDPFWDRDKL